MTLSSARWTLRPGVRGTQAANRQILRQVGTDILCPWERRQARRV